ncbi:hypothetical protein DPMN_034162 [Dreissena polymorpha]|uniref:Uncharacterized protein n=1 Tax=Dreissena polymorpha TaxID=45954 RepID=A0A9D4M6A3_DREPO|nr:hypothetical protein DPMN_034162 [Dreissena polymorpha]
MLDQVLGSLTDAAYSSWGLTSDVYAFALMSVGQVARFLRRKADVEFAFLAVMSIWLFHVSLLSMVTPRYLALSVCLSVWPWMLYEPGVMFRLLVIRIISHFVRTNNDVEGWHNRLNRRAKKGNLSFYLLITLLFDEANEVPMQCKLLKEKKFQRHQSRQTRATQGSLCAAWLVN